MTAVLPSFPSTATFVPQVGDGTGPWTTVSGGFYPAAANETDHYENMMYVAVSRDDESDELRVVVSDLRLGGWSQVNDPALRAEIVKAFKAAMVPA